MLKRKIDKSYFESLPDVIKAEYKADGENYLLDIDDSGIDELKRAKDREKERAKEAEKKAKELETELEQVKATVGSKGTDIATLEKSWNEKHTKAITDKDNEIGKYKNTLKEQLIDSVAMGIASEISKSPKLLIPHIKSRLAVDFDADKPATKVLDANGAISALTIDELKNELVANKDFSAIIVANRSSGSSKTTNMPSPGSSGNQQTPNLATMKPAELAAHIKANSSATS